MKQLRESLAGLSSFKWRPALPPNPTCSPVPAVRFFNGSFKVTKKPPSRLRGSQRRAGERVDQFNNICRQPSKETRAGIPTSPHKNFSRFPFTRFPVQAAFPLKRLRNNFSKIIKVPFLLKNSKNDGDGITKACRTANKG